MSIFHDASSFKHRSPLGAARTGETIKISLQAPFGDARGGEVIIYGGEFEKRVSLQREGDLLFAELIMPEKPMVLWYHFLLNGYPDDFYCSAGENGLRSVTGHENPKGFQLTVYKSDFITPQWFSGKIMYQIFPDRFARDESDAFQKGIKYHEAKGRRVRVHEDWNESVCWEALPAEAHYVPDDYFGGTLRGIAEKLPYLKELGVGVLYLNPIFEANSNHRYNTSDYLKIDPMLGTNEDFEKLCERAASLDIKILLDGVFSHTGSDSVYFNREGRYESIGAYQGEESEYYKWYDFKTFPDDYRSWWGFETLPEVNEENPQWQDFIYKSEKSVVKTWLKRGAGGFRLDVADELPDEVLAGIYSSAKELDGEAVILGEVWEDPTTKESYGHLRKYALGGMLDSVMNYPLRKALISFLQGKTTAYQLKDFLLSQKLNYPKPMYVSLMNLLSSHDAPRIRTALVLNADELDSEREKQAYMALSKRGVEHGKKLQKLAAALQFSLPGVPCIYYGDEQGMEGAYDPFNRETFKRQEPETESFYKSLSKMRLESRALYKGEAGFFAISENALAVLRLLDDEIIIIAVNRGAEAVNAKLSLQDFEGLSEKAHDALHGRSAELEISPMGWTFLKL
ncbi:glycoside hydrolase family 13 protein [Clostridiaceae bacterium OttesenSCG-928-D20]|nr:glycoside hydrolase family 13 protein [Clostridiaceae bacterium OttesenSCG-928-D20]